MPEKNAVTLLQDGEIHLVDDGDEEKEISDGTYSWKELEKAGWKGETMWMLFSEKETEDLYGKIEHFLSELERVMQLNMTAYLSENEFGEELQNVLQRLEEQNEQNVSVEHGIVDEEVRTRFLWFSVGIHSELYPAQSDFNR